MDLNKDPKDYNLDLHCPRCGHLVRATIEAGPIFHISDISDTTAYLICRCPRHLCDVIFVKYDRLNRCVSEVFPYPDCSPSDYHKSIPENVRRDYAEAKKCYFANAYKSVVVMCRRAMQGIAADKGAKGKTLGDQIDDLFSKGLITRSLKDSAHEIRYFGNFGAHPQDDGLDEISYKDAKAVLGLVDSFLTDLYVRPHNTAELMQKRKEAKN